METDERNEGAYLREALHAMRAALRNETAGLETRGRPKRK